MVVTVGLISGLKVLFWMLQLDGKNGFTIHGMRREGDKPIMIRFQMH